jgi:glycerate-2-kinase
MKGEIDWENLRKYREAATYIEYIESQVKIMGDQINATGSGITIVNRSTVQNAFNRVKSEYGEETAKALTLVEQAINKAGKKEAAENFESFNDELQKPEPKKAVLKTLWQGILFALPTLKEIPDVVNQITKLFT